MNRRPTLSQRGSVLIVVMWVSIGLVSVALLFGHSMIMTYRGADNDLAGRQADLAIEGAVRYAEMLFVNPTVPGAMPDLTAYKGEAVPVGEAKFWFLGMPPDTATGRTGEFGLVDEAAKLNLNTATVEMLRMLPGMTDALAASIIDWRDTDETLTTNGAESTIYAQKSPAYKAKNAPFESVEELALINGATREILYGDDANLNGLLEPNEDDGETTLPADNSDGKLDAGILAYVTVYSRESNKQSDGTTARINLAQPGEELTTLLTEDLGEARATEIQANLGAAPVASVLDFYVRGQLKADELGKVIDALTVGTEEYRTGMINVNTASSAVLACLPGIGTNNATKVVAARQNRPATDTNIAWLVDAIGAEAAVQAGPFITGQTSQVSADVAAVGRQGRGFRRTRFVIDTSTGAPRVVYRRNLAPFGWALGSEVRESYAQNKEAR